MIPLHTSTCSRSAALLVLASSLVCCGEPLRAPPSTLRSPSALEALQWCTVLEDGQAAAHPVTDDCAASADHRVAIANRGTREVHLLEIDERNPFLLDLDDATPGINGLRVGDGPVSVAATAIPALAAVVSEREPALAFVDGAFRRVVPIRVGDATLQRYALEGPAGLVVATGDGRVVWTEPVARVIRTARFELACGDGALLRSDCEPLVTLTPGPSVALTGTPAHIALHPDGRLWVAYADTPLFAVVSIDGSDAACGGVPCVVATRSIAPPCADGVDNDRDGHIDAADAQCFGPDDDESGALFDDSIAACADGVDNDGDGQIDADDPDCRSAGGRSEGPAADNSNCANGSDDDLDGAVDGDDAACSEGSGEFPRATAADQPTDAPTCADGVDNDGDGVTDAADPQCYSAAGDSEAAPAQPVAGRIAIFPEGDYVAVVDVTAPQLLIFDAATFARVDVNGANRLRTGAGITIPQRLPTAVVTDSIEVFDTEMTDGRRLKITDRVVHVATTGGQAHTFDIDRTFSVVDSLGNELQREVELLLRRRDASPSAAEIRAVSCSLPNAIFGALGVLSIGCGDERLPALAVIDEERRDPEAPSWISQPGDALVSLPERTTWTLSEAADALEPLVLADEYRVAGDAFAITWEGRLPAAWRNDVVLVEPGVLRALGTEPCEVYDDVCASTLELGECPELEELCQGGVDVCAEGIDVCAVCPSACEDAVDYCAAGVVAGDTVVLSAPDRAPDASGRCDETSEEASTAGIRWEFEILAVSQSTLTIAPLVADDPRLAPPSAQAVPGAECWDRPFAAEVRAGDAWVLEGRQAFGHPSPRIGVDGVCVVRDDGHVRNGRPRSGQRFTSQYGMSLELVEGTEPPFRDYAISFTAASGFATRETRSRQFLLGPATSAAVVTETQRGRRVVFADEAQDYVWIYSALTFASAASPIP